MLNHWGYKFFVVGTAIAYTELDLVNYRRQRAGVSDGHDVIIDIGNPILKFLKEKCEEALKFTDDEDLGAIPQNLRRLQAKLLIAGTPHAPTNKLLYINDLLTDVTRIKNDFLYVLGRRSFYSISPELLKYYGQPQLFGERVAKRFKAACADIERAGNCLALGEPTACVLHLNRAMEIALHSLARKLRITPLATDNMGSILGKMTEPIKNLPDKTEPQKRKKEKWAECRTNLYHVKMAWRDPGAHGKQSYDHKRASDILRRVDDFMQQLATL